MKLAVRIIVFGIVYIQMSITHAQIMIHSSSPEFWVEDYLKHHYGDKLKDISSIEYIDTSRSDSTVYYDFPKRKLKVSYESESGNPIEIKETIKTGKRYKNKAGRELEIIEDSLTKETYSVLNDGLYYLHDKQYRRTYVIFYKRGYPHGSSYYATGGTIYYGLHKYNKLVAFLSPKRTYSPLRPSEHVTQGMKHGIWINIRTPHMQRVQEEKYRYGRIQSYKSYFGSYDIDSGRKRTYSKHRVTRKEWKGAKARYFR